MPPDFLNPTLDLFESIPHTVVLDPGVKLLCGFAVARGVELLAVIADIVSISPFRHVRTSGGRMSVARTNCGAPGWVTYRTGYRYDSIDPETRDRWPAMPQSFADFAAQAAEAIGFPNFIPDACLVNRYEPGARLSLHQDKNERDFSQPIVSVSLGMPAIFLFGGLERGDKTQRIQVIHGDVLVWGGSARLRYHGIAPLKDSEHPRLGRVRYNLTFRNAG